MKNHQIRVKPLRDRFEKPPLGAFSKLSITFTPFEVTTIFLSPAISKWVMAKKSKFLLVSLQEDQAKKLAQVLSNDTSRKIIDHLADKEDTEANIAKILGLPISTVHYNLTLLTQGGLVDAGEFHYSTKGREVKHYKLANQYILIAPRSTFGLKERLKGLLPAVGVLGGVSLALRWLASPVQPLADTFAQSGAQDASHTLGHRTLDLYRRLDHPCALYRH